MNNLGLNRSDSKENPKKNGSDRKMTVESWLFGLGFQDFVNAFIEFGYDNLDFIVSIIVISILSKIFKLIDDMKF